MGAKILWTGLFCLATLVLGVFASSTATVSITGAISPARTGRWFDYVVVILLENHGINTTYGNACLGNCSFFNLLANTNGLAENYDKGGVPGSLGDYIAITSGDGSEHCNSSPTTCPFNDVNIVDRIEGKALTWRAYVEDYPSSCGSSCSGGGCFTGSGSSPGFYSSIHNPFVYYKDVINNPSRCSKIVPANSVIPPTQSTCGSSIMPGTVETDDLLLSDLNSVTSAANYNFLTPNSIDDLHDCSTGDVSLGNHYLQQLIPQILNSTLFRTKSAALFVTFDEPDPFAGGTQNLYTVWASHGSSVTKSAYKSTQNYNHYFALRTIEDNWGLSPINSTDTAAGNMGEFLK